MYLTLSPNPFIPTLLLPLIERPLSLSMLPFLVFPPTISLSLIDWALSRAFLAFFLHLVWTSYLFKTFLFSRADTERASSPSCHSSVGFFNFLHFSPRFLSLPLMCGLASGSQSSFYTELTRDGIFFGKKTSLDFFPVFLLMVIFFHVIHTYVFLCRTQLFPAPHFLSNFWLFSFLPSPSAVLVFGDRSNSTWRGDCVTTTAFFSSPFVGSVVFLKVFIAARATLLLWLFRTASNCSLLFFVLYLTPWSRRRPLPPHHFGFGVVPLGFCFPTSTVKSLRPKMLGPPSLAPVPFPSFSLSFCPSLLVL